MEGQLLPYNHSCHGSWGGRRGLVFEWSREVQMCDALEDVPVLPAATGFLTHCHPSAGLWCTHCVTDHVGQGETGQQCRDTSESQAVCLESRLCHRQFVGLRANY